jgi:hypothetical protein
MRFDRCAEGGEEGVDAVADGCDGLSSRVLVCRFGQEFEGLGAPFVEFGFGCCGENAYQ